MSELKPLAPLAPVKVPPLFDFSTAEGLRCTVGQRAGIPLVAVRLVLRGGSTADPAGMAGLTDFMLRLLRRGTLRHSAEQLDEAIEFAGGALHSGSFEDYASVVMTVPVPQLTQLLGVMGELLRQPKFAPAEVKAARARTLAEMANDLDDPGTVADRALGPALYGTHPYAHDVGGSRKSVGRFTREALVRFHQERLGPRTLRLHIVGPVDVPTVKRAVEKAFGGWKSKASVPKPPPPLELPPHSGEVWILDKPEQTQSQIRIGARCHRRGDPQSFPMRVLAAAVGGGFTSRLVNEIRVNRGLSYGVGLSLDAQLAAGSLTLTSFTKTETTRELIDVGMGILNEVRASGLKLEEIEHAKRYLAGTYPMRTETNEAMVASLSDLDFYGIEPSYIENYRNRIQAVTPEEIQAAAQAYLLPEPPVMVVVGRAKVLKKQLEGLGRIRVMQPSQVE